MSLSNFWVGFFNHSYRYKRCCGLPFGIQIHFLTNAIYKNMLHTYSINMKTFKITWYKGTHFDPYMTGDNLIKADTEEDALDIFNNEYLSKGRHWDSIVDCSSLEYQLAYDNEQFDSNGRRRF